MAEERRWGIWNGVCARSVLAREKWNCWGKVKNCRRYLSPSRYSSFVEKQPHLSKYKPSATPLVCGMKGARAFPRREIWPRAIGVKECGGAHRSTTTELICHQEIPLQEPSAFLWFELTFCAWQWNKKKPWFLLLFWEIGIRVVWCSKLNSTLLILALVLVICYQMGCLAC